jgi:Activator of Hsp90 ATPase homolog 1-like protein
LSSPVRPHAQPGACGAGQGSISAAVALPLNWLTTSEGHDHDDCPGELNRMMSRYVRQFRRLNRGARRGRLPTVGSEDEREARLRHRAHPRFPHPRERVYKAFTDPDEFARWYGPVGFPVRRDTVELDARAGGSQRFVMVSEADPSIRTGFTGSFTEVIPNRLLASSGSWDGIPGQKDPWPS